MREFLIKRSPAGWSDATESGKQADGCEYYPIAAGCYMQAKKKAQAKRKKKKPQRKGRPPRAIPGHTFQDSLFHVEGTPVWALDENHAAAKYKRWKEQNKT